MHKLRPSTARTGVGVHLVRIVALSAALTALGGIVVADVLGADLEEPTALALLADDGASSAEPGPPLLAAAIVVPDDLRPAAADLPPVPLDLDALRPPRQKKPRKPRAGKLKFGRFEGY